MTRQRQPSQPCPTCGSKSRVTTTRKLSNTTTERYHQCTNLDCQHQFKTLTEVAATIIPPISKEKKTS